MGQLLHAQPDDEFRQMGAILQKRCLTCHGPEKQEGGYRVDTIARLRLPGDSGAVPIVPGRPSESELVKRLKASDPEVRMPAQAESLTASQIASFEKWISDGAKADALLESEAIATWARETKPVKMREHYPAALPITAIAIGQTIEDRLTLWTSGYGEVLRWECTETGGRLQQRVTTAGDHVSDLDLISSGKLMAVASGEPGTQGHVQLFALNNDSATLVWSKTCRDLPADLAFAPDGKHLAVGQADGSLWLVQLDQEDPAHSATQIMVPHADTILAVGWSSNCDRLITASRDRTAKIFSTSDWQLIANYDRHERAVGGAAYLKDKPVSLDETGTLRLWSGDDNDRTLAERGNLARFLEPVVCTSTHAWLAIGADLQSFSVERKTEEDGKDDKGNPKQKKITRWQADTLLNSGSCGWLLSLDVDEKFVVSGNESGDVFVWVPDSREAKYKFTARP